MVSGNRAKIIELARKSSGGLRPSEFARRLSITPQAVHRHLRELGRLGVLRREGSAPHARYRIAGAGDLPAGLLEESARIREILSAHPAIRLVTLFGSQARGRARPDSDIDLLVWVGEGEPFGREEIWRYWDRHSRHLKWRNKASLVVRRLSDKISVDTLLLDLPEEHIPLYDPSDCFAMIRAAVLSWRKRWGSKKLPSFGGTHAWIYSTKVNRLSEIDFQLELKHVA